MALKDFSHSQLVSGKVDSIEGLPGVLKIKGTSPFTLREQRIFSNNFKGTRELFRYIREQGNIDFRPFSNSWRDFLSLFMKTFPTFL